MTVDLVKMEELAKRLTEQHSITNGDIDSIIAYVEFSNGVRHEAAAVLTSAKAEIERLKELVAKKDNALRPFAEKSVAYDDIPGVLRINDNVELWQVQANKGMEITFTVGDLRRAAAAMGEK